MKMSLGISVISLMLLFGGCNTPNTPEQGQSGAPGAAGQPDQSAQTGQPGQPGQVASSSGEVDESTTSAPPALPVYDQPDIPGPGYIWTPGYWGWSSDDGDYYWVPGTWVQPPEPDVLWTPGYWGWGGSAYNWHHGYWGSQVGFYGGVNYGFGYTGDSYEGGRWDHGAFYYNRSVNNIGNVRSITNVYDQTVSNNVTVNNVSYNGGNGGRNAQPTAAQRAADSERHIPRTTEQTQHQHAASTNRALLASANHGKPPIAATAKPGVFSGGGVVAAKAAAPYHPSVPPTARGAAARSPNPAGGETRPPVTEHPAVEQPRNEPRPQAVQPKIEPRPQATQPRNEPRPQAVQPKIEPRPQAVQPRNEPRPQAVQPRSEPRPQAVQPRSEPRPQAVQPKSEPRPQAVQPKSAPPPSGEKPKEEHEPSR
ncbi:MAG: hypothetical protein ABSG32_09670 [Terriglobia bacterium]